MNVCRERQMSVNVECEESNSLIPDFDPKRTLPNARKLRRTAIVR